MGQSCVRALRRPGVRNGDGASHPLASRELEHLAPHLLDLRDRSHRTQDPDGLDGAGLGYRSAHHFAFGII